MLGNLNAKTFLRHLTNLVKIRQVYSHFAEEKKVHFCKHWTHTTSRNPCNCDDLSATCTSPKCHFDSRRNMSREPCSFTIFCYMDELQLFINMANPWNGRSFGDYHTYMHIYIYKRVCVYVCMYVCMCVCDMCMLHLHASYVTIQFGILWFMICSMRYFFIYSTICKLVLEK